MTDSKIEANNRSLGEIFGKDNYRFEIPAYQRPYSWTKKEAGELLEDVIEAMNEGRDQYFLGSLVLVKTPGEKLAQVVDGQQRLTTLTILFSVLRDLMAEDQAISGAIDKFVTAERDALNKQSQGTPVLLVRNKVQERTCFWDVVQRPGATLSSPQPSSASPVVAQLYVSNANSLRSDVLRAALDIPKLVTYLRDKCFLVVVEVPSPSEARRIFQVLNARGLDLQATDFLKAQILEKCSCEKVMEQYAERWEIHEEAVGRDVFAQLFTHIRIMKAGRKSKGALEDQFSKDVKEFGEISNFFNRVLDPIVDHYLVCSDNQKAVNDFGDECAEKLRSLWRVDNRNWLPPLLAYLCKFGSEGFHDFLGRLERQTYYLFVMRKYENVRINRAVDVLKAIEDAESSTDLLSDARLDLSKHERKEFLEALDGDIYGTKPCLPVLLRLNDAISEGALIYTGKTTIEHVLPQTPGEGWKDFSEEDYEEWTDHLANLVLLSRKKNSSAGNKPFKEKKESYFCDENGKTSFPLTQDVLLEEEWDLRALRSRRKKLRAKMKSIWDI
ncbi:DUF262 domain-containing protein [Pelagimonas sp. KU-00592-HH]|uniref:DUF262 domain-containing protein n=1 Tax=Pelagimonas sp. KU-00592-HH TaxID=3127651 RepID=UPI00310289C7